MNIRTTILKTIDLTVGPVLCRILGCINFRAGHETVTSDIKPDSARRILIIRPGGMGDMIVLLPVMKILQARFPDVVVDLVCEKRNIEVLKLIGLKESAMAYDSNPIGFLRRLVRQEYDIVIDTEQFHHFSAVFAFLSGASVRIGFKINPRRNPLYTHLINYALDGPEGEQFMKLLGPLGINDDKYSLEGVLSGIEAEKDLPPVPSPLAVIHPGSSTVYKLWGTDKFADFVRLLHEQHGLGAVFVGGERDGIVIDGILNRLKGGGCTSVSYAGRLNLAMTAAVMKQARLFVGSDSGLAHLAVAIGVPTVVLFGPSDHLKWGVDNERHAVVQTNLPCAPCFIFGYHKPCRAIDCMKQIKVEDVLKACSRVLDAG